MARKSLQVFALLRAAKVLGGMAALATRFGISPMRLTLYLEDEVRVVDPLVEDEITKLLGTPHGQRPRHGHEAGKTTETRKLTDEKH